MRTILKTVKCDCSKLLYPTEDGESAALREGQWVEFKRKVTPGNMRMMLGFAQSAGAQDYGLLADGLDALSALLARKIVAWNWTDLETGAALPTPSIEVLNELDFDDLLNLVNLYVETVFPSKN